MNIRCKTCGTELAAGVSYCRQCGAAITPDGVVESSELPTSLFPNTDIASTQRLDPRPTSEPQRSAAVSTDIRSHPEKKSWKAVVALAAVALIVATLVGVFALTRLRNQNRTTADGLFYPGAQTLVDFTNTDGGRALQLQTPDAFEKVEDWYERSLRPSKIVRLTSTSVVLKNDDTTATIASEGGMTNILIKMRAK